MAEFILNQPIETSDSKIEVNITSKAPLRIGKAQFQLVVVDESGNTSTPAFMEVIIKDTERPTAVLDAPSQVEAGRDFILVGDRSTDLPPGRIVKYIWTLVSTG